MIETTKAYSTEDGKTFQTLRDAQIHALGIICGNEEIAIRLLESPEKAIKILKMKPRKPRIVKAAKAKAKSAAKKAKKQNAPKIAPVKTSPPIETATAAAGDFQ